MNMQASILGAILVLHVVGSSPAADGWLRFRGPNGSGISADERVVLHWSREKNIRWRAPLPAPGNSSPIAVGEVVFITCATDEGRYRSLYCFDRSTGKQRWVFPTRGRVESSPVIVGKRVFVGSSDGNLYAVDAQTGKETWRFEAGGEILASPAVADGSLVISTMDGTVYCFGAPKANNKPAESERGDAGVEE